MIVSSLPRPSHAWRAILVPVLLLIVWDTAVTVLYFNERTHFEGVEIQFTLFGSAIALFIGFMVNAAYGRWWEARTLWGQIVNSSRSLGRQTVVLLDEDVPNSRVGLAAEVVRAQVAYVHILRTALRNQPLPPEATSYLDDDARDDVAAASNRQTAVLTRIVTEAARRGMIGEFARVQIEMTLVALTDAQGGLERFKNTPLPVQYRFLPRFRSATACTICG